MARLAITAAGGIAGSFFGPVGAQLGLAGGSLLSNFLLGPEGENQHVEGPRLQDLRVQTSAYGELIPKKYGTVRLPGKVCWSSGIIEHENTETVEAGKGGGPETTETTYYYTCSWASFFCVGEVAQVRRVWFDADLVYDASDEATDATRAASETFKDNHFVFYEGAESDAVDPTIAAYEGAANTPAFLGICKIVFTDVLLESYGRRIPNVTAELSTDPIDLIDWQSGTPPGTSVPNANWALVDITRRHYYGTEPGSGTGFFHLYKTWVNDLSYFQRNVLFTFRCDLKMNTSTRAVHLSALNVDLVACHVKVDVVNSGALLEWYPNGIGDSYSIESLSDDWWRIEIVFNTGASTNTGRLLAVTAGGCNQVTPFSTQYGYLAQELEIKNPSFQSTTGAPQGTETLQDVLTAICADAGLEAADIDVTEIPAATVVRGYVTGQQSARGAVENLEKGFAFDGFESQGKIKFTPRGGASVATIDADELALGVGRGATAEAFGPTRGGELELPRRVSITYMQAAKLYQPGEAHAQRIITQAKGEQNTDLRLVMSDDEAGKACDVLLYGTWAERVRFSFMLPIKYYYLDPADVITITDGSKIFVMRLVSITLENLALLRVEAVEENPGLYESNWTAAGGPSDDQTVGLPGETETVLLDLPMLSESQDYPLIQFACGGTSASWQGARFFRSTDGGSNYESVSSFSLSSRIGTVAAVLGASAYHTWDDTTTIDVELEHDGHTLESRSDSAVLSGANGCAIGAAGRWEVLQFANAALVTGSTWRLSRLLRGRLGTEHSIGNHAGGDRFVLLQAGLTKFKPVNISEIGVTRQYKGVGVGVDIADVTAVSHAYQGENLKPRSSVAIAGARDGSNNLTVSWLRRSRYSSAMLHSPIMGEVSEAYEVDIMSGSTVLRTITASAETAVYTAAEQTTDGLTPGDPVAVEIYQISDSVGRGTAGTATI